MDLMDILAGLVEHFDLMENDGDRIALIIRADAAVARNGAPEIRPRVGLLRHLHAGMLESLLHYWWTA